MKKRVRHHTDNLLLDRFVVTDQFEALSNRVLTRKEALRECLINDSGRSGLHFEIALFEFAPFEKPDLHGLKESLRNRNVGRTKRFGRTPGEADERGHHECQDSPAHRPLLRQAGPAARRVIRRMRSRSRVAVRRCCSLFNPLVLTVNRIT